MTTNTDILVLGCATHKTTNVDYFQKSFQLFDGWDMRLVGLGKKWEGFRTKMEIYCETLQMIDPMTIVVCLDTNDMLCIKDSTGFRETFLQFKSPIVIGSEKQCFPTIHNNFIKIGVCSDISQWKQYHNEDQNIFMNSGCVIGYAGEILLMLRWVLDYTDIYITDDQVGIGFYMNQFPEKIRLDVEGVLVYNNNWGRRSSITKMGDNKIMIDTPTHPYFIHFPGLSIIFSASTYYTLCSFLFHDPDIHLYSKHSGLNKIFIIILIVLLLLLFLMIIVKCCRRKK